MHNWQNKIHPDAILVSGAGVSWDRQALIEQVRLVCDGLNARRMPQAPVAVLADNSPEWLAIDLATQELGITLVPLPSFFTPAQWVYAIEAAGAQAIFCAQADHAHALGYPVNIPCGAGLGLYESPREHSGTSLPNVQKLTFTSGTTSQPKGVCLSTQQQWNVALDLQACLAGLEIRRHLTLLPFPVLLENIAGAYTALLSGATNICLPLAQTGLRGASHFDPHICLDAIQRHQAESVILLPQMLQALVAVAKLDDARIRSLKFIAVGGAKTPAALLQAARAKGFPVYEGYGLSECSSVVSLNLPHADRMGSCGKPLPHRRVRIADDGEIEVGGIGAVHYLGEPPMQVAWLPTGDLGHLDEDGFLYIDGRKKNVLITAYGRNVSPEWPESVLLGTGLVAQAVVFGDARPYLVAAIVPISRAIDASVLRAAIDRANAELPDYARIGRWFITEPFTPADATATANGRPRRDAIAQRCREQIETAYNTDGE